MRDGSEQNTTMLLVITVIMSLSVVTSSIVGSTLVLQRSRWCLDLVVDEPSKVGCAPPYHLEQMRDGVFACGCVRIVPRTKVNR